MKTNLFIAAALFLSAGTHAQTLNSSAAQSSSTAASVNKKTTDISTVNSANTTVANNAAEKKSAINSEAKQEAKQGIKAAATTANAGEQQAKKETAAIVKENRESVSVSSGTQANASTKYNKVGGDASLNTEVSVSPKNTAKAVAVRSTNAAKTTVHAVSATSAKVNGTVTKTVQPKPVAIKTQARIATTSGIKIK